MTRRTRHVLSALLVCTDVALFLTLVPLWHDMVFGQQIRMAMLVVVLACMAFLLSVSNWPSVPW